MYDCAQEDLLSTTILLVEDNKMQKLAHERILTRAGFAVICAVDGAEAVQMALEKSPDIILLDMLLPKMSGVQVLQALQQHAETARIPVIVLSALPQVNEAKLRAAGAIGYFMKSRLLDDKDGESALVELLSRTARETRERNAATAVD